MDLKMQWRPNGSNNVDVGSGVNVSHALFNEDGLESGKMHLDPIANH